MEAPGETEVHNTCSYDRKDTNLLDDFLDIIKSITDGQAWISFKTIENILECSIKCSKYLPNVTVIYNNSLKNVTEKDINVTTGIRFQGRFSRYNKFNVDIKNLEEIKSYKESINSPLVERKNVEQIEDILHDLLLLIEVIITKRAYISSMIDGNISVYSINSSICQYSVILSYINHDSINTKSYTNEISKIVTANNNESTLIKVVSYTITENKVEFLNKPEIVNLHELSSEEPLKNKSPAKLSKIKVITGKSRYVCTYCDKTFKFNSRRQEHEKIHSGEKPYACSYCDKTFSVKSNKIRHEKTHTCEKPYVCTFCNKTFMTNTEKQVHERIHTGERPHTCTYCDKTFRTSSEKQVHERIHTGERPYTCTYCNKNFRTHTEKQVHERVHTGERPYACAYCDKFFSVNCHKLRHEKTHTGEKPYVCTFCNKTFKTNSEKHMHERIHTGERPHACAYCNKTFRTRTEKQVHECIHTGNRPYACTYCHKSFSTKSRKQVHERTQHTSNILQGQNILGLRVQKN